MVDGMRCCANLHMPDCWLIWNLPESPLPGVSGGAAILGEEVWDGYTELMLLSSELLMVGADFFFFRMHGSCGAYMCKWGSLPP